MARTRSSFSWGAVAGWLIFAVALAVFDQYAKYWIQHRMIVGDSEQITGFFNLVVAYNTGAAFSFLADAGGWQKYLFTGIAALTAVIISIIIGRKSSQKWLCLGLALVLAGAIGNVYDRLTLGMVVDFLDFHAFGYHWPAFNVADICICVGAAIVVLYEFFNPSSR